MREAVAYDQVAPSDACALDQYLVKRGATWLTEDLQLLWQMPKPRYVLDGQSRHNNCLPLHGQFIIENELTRSDPFEVQFRTLRDEWVADIRYSSSGTEIVNHVAYLRIIAMGMAVVPLILQELRKRVDHWFWALFIITGHDPVPLEDRGNLEKMRDAWLQWADSQTFSTTGQNGG